MPYISGRYGESRSSILDTLGGANPSMPTERAISEAVNQPAGYFARGKGALARFTSTPGHKWAWHTTKQMYGIGIPKGPGAWIGRSLGFAFAGYETYRGYKKGGAWGAAKGLGKSVASTYVINRVLFALGKAITGPLGAIGIAAGAVYGTNAIVKSIDERNRRYARLEMGAPVEDQFGNLATGRQRAMMAMQRSHINGRSAMGNEAALMYRPYFR